MLTLPLFLIWSNMAGTLIRQRERGLAGSGKDVM
jgi:hypothetical protein